MGGRRKEGRKGGRKEDRREEEDTIKDNLCTALFHNS
jgi:hypothetical protein